MAAVFDRCIASIAFHAKGDIPAVVSGHKVLIFVVQLFCSSIMLKVHFHPHAAPFLLTAEMSIIQKTFNIFGFTCDILLQLFLWQMLIPVNVLMTAELPLISLPFFFVPSFAIDGLTSMQVKPSASMRFQVDANEVQ
ncbi:hypothetical protein CFP56_018582 [Quercus suber]|uniref:Uncharacterized protein n=1 Tax=Quercus suber TaxID=58331 RepID=A0AAW0M306_QUESU